MSREIKFRIWNGKKYVTEPDNKDYEYFLDPLDGEIVTVNTSWEGGGSVDCLTSRGYEIDYFSGLRDSLTNRIFEGDILQGANSVIYSVLFGKGAFLSKVERLFLGDKSSEAQDKFPGPYYLGDLQLSSIEIIGNIREHKHLLS